MMEKIKIITPQTGKELSILGDFLVDSDQNRFPVIDNIPRISELDNYTSNFGFQWNKFSKTQIDNIEYGNDLSKSRFFSETGWSTDSLSGKNILEVGSGAGRFSRVVLESTNANLYSVDYSDAVTANLKNNGSIDPDRFNLFQASIYELPFPDNSFDNVFCLGVLQHTPNFSLSVEQLIKKTKISGEIVVDFYPINGWWSKLNAKYILRPLLKKMSDESLLKLIEMNINWLIIIYRYLGYFGLSILRRFLPICEINTFPDILTKDEVREWAILDTFDMFSPEYDSPQYIEDVAAMFEQYGVDVTFSGYKQYGNNGSAAVVRGIKKS